LSRLSLRQGRTWPSENVLTVRRALLAALFAAFAACHAAIAAAGEPQIMSVRFESRALSGFLGHAAYMYATVLLPDSYYAQAHRRYPVIYVIPAFDGPFTIDEQTELSWQRPMRALGTQFIIVVLDGMVQFRNEAIHQEFVDSPNDGPWGTALTNEFIPATDAHFRTIDSPNARFLFGHSSGAWSALWLQVTYPQLFNGAWAVSPDPVDFHDFVGPDLTKAPAQNFYVDAAGAPYMISRVRGHDTMTLRDMVRREDWARRQMDTYDDVFSPRSASGSPERLFNRKTGAIDADVARYWEEHFDITHLLVEHWAQLGPELGGKLHIFVGTDDTFHLEEAVRLMQAATTPLGSDAEFVFAPGDDHWQIFGWNGGVQDYAMREMIQRVSAMPPR